MSTKATHVDIYPMETLSSMVVVKHRDNEADYQHDSKSNRDEVELAHFGKRQQLKRTFGLVSMTGLTCTLMVTWEGILIAFASGLGNGGPSGLVYGYLFVWAGTVTQVLIMAELGSMIPLSGGHYNWVAILSPPSCSKFLSYLTGWVSVIAWQAGLASGAFIGGTIIQGLLVLNHPDYVFQRWHGTLLFYAIVVIALFVNTYLVRMLPRIESIVLIIHIIGFFGILIPLVYFAPHGSPADVFATFNNGGGWSTTGLSFFVGLATSIFSFIGIDAASHMGKSTTSLFQLPPCTSVLSALALTVGMVNVNKAEEIENAAIIIPRSMCASVIINGFLGLGMLIAVLFCLGNLEDALSTPTGFPFIEIFRQATNSTSGGTVMSSLIVAAVIFAATGFLTTASRMTWAFAREKGLPGSTWLAKVDPRTSLPLGSIAFTVVVNCLLALINIGSSTAFNALTSLVIAAFYSSFLLSASMLLLKRLTLSADSIRWGPFRLGRLGLPINILSILFTIIGLFFSFWPPSREVTAKTMNWSIVVYGGVMLFSIFFWFIHGRSVYTGPVIEVHND